MCSWGTEPTERPLVHLIPTQEEVLAVLRETGALREGHFEYPSGSHSNEYLQIPLAMRYYQYQRMLAVGVSRLLRAHPEIRAMVHDLSIVTPMTGGLPVAYGVCEALRAKQVYWTERDHDGEPLRFRQFLTPHAGEQVVLVDDILRTGSKLAELKQLLESHGATVVALAVVIYQPTPDTYDFGSLPFYYLAKLDASYYADAAHCEMCERGLPCEKVWI
jgi:orotate phosphoribosyltransferase